MAHSDRAGLQSALAGVRVSPAVERGLLITAGAASWFIYFLVEHLLVMERAVSFTTPLDAKIPFLPGAEWVYVMAYPFGLLPGFQIRDLTVLRRYVGAFAAMQVVACLLFVLLPIRIERPEGVDAARSFAEWGVLLVYKLDPLPMKCFPSLHVANACFAASVAAWLDRRVGRVTIPIAAAIAVSTVLTKQHYVADVLGGALLAFAAYQAAFGGRRLPRPAHATYPRRYLAAIPLIYAAMVVAAWIIRSLGW